jgi:hypothetical protein
MEYIRSLFNRLGLQNAGPLKIAGLVIGCLLLVLIVLRLSTVLVMPLLGVQSISETYNGIAAFAPSARILAPQMYGGVGGPVAYEEMAKMSDQSLSVRNIVSPQAAIRQTSEITAENYEVSEFTATIETHDLDRVCGTTIPSLKPKEYVVFENSNTYAHGCSVRFKVKHDHVTEILAFIKALNPRDITDNTYTIKQQIDDFTSQEDILNRRLRGQLLRMIK